MHKDIYIFPAIITKLGDNDYNVTFPDFAEIVTYGETVEEAYIMAEDVFKLFTAITGSIKKLFGFK